MLSLVLTFTGLLLALPQVTVMGWGASPPRDEPASASPNTGPGPSTDRPGVGEAEFANGEAASAFAAAKARAGVDTQLDGLSGDCSFAGTASMDWTPPAGTSRQQQAICPGRPNLWVHWSTGPFTRGVLACTGTWYNSCAPTSAEITGRLPTFDWMGRVRIGHVFTVGG